MSLTPEDGSLSEDEKAVFEEMMRHYGPVSGEGFWDRIQQRWKPIVAGIGLAALVGFWIVHDQGAEHSSPYGNIDRVKLEALKDARALNALGVCDPELRAEASLEEYRMGRGMGFGPTTGMTITALRNAASVARNYGVSCDPGGATSPASYKATASDGSTVMLFPESLVKLDASEVCGFIDNPLLAPAPDPADSENYKQLVYKLALQLKSETDQHC